MGGLLIDSDSSVRRRGGHSTVARSKCAILPVAVNSGTIAILLQAVCVIAVRLLLPLLLQLLWRVDTLLLNPLSSNDGT